MRLTLERLATRISTEAMRRLQMECKKRGEATATRVTYGTIITELVLNGLSEQPGGWPDEAEPEVPPRPRPTRAKTRAA